MMEVKQNTQVDLNELMNSGKDSVNDEVDDAVMTDLSERTHDLDCDLIKRNDMPPAILEVENGVSASLINEVDDEVGTDIDVPTELEDALLAEDDVLPKLTTKEVEPSTTDDDILADKVETSNSTTSSINVRDPGDDLDTLLSKINDIVDDCIDNDNESAVVITEIQKESPKKTEILENNEILDESVILVEESIIEDCNLNNDDDALNEIEEKTDKEIEIENKSLEREEEKINEISEDVEMSEIVTNNIEKETEEENNVNNELNDAVTEDTSSKETQIENDISVDTADKENKIEDEIENISEVAASTINLEHKTPEETEEIKTEAVQDSEITSNSDENSEIIKSRENIESDLVNRDKTQSLEINDTQCDDKEKGTLSIDNTEKEVPTNISDEVKTSDKVENEESDDEIVFYVDKPPEIEKPKDEVDMSENTSVQKEAPAPPKTSEEDDDVVLLLDDDDDIDPTKNDVSSEQKDSIAIKEQETNQKSECEKPILENDDSSKADMKSSDIDIDNSDNACDDFNTEKPSEDKEDAKVKTTETPEETNSNCSSSSNLLQEAKSVDGDETTPEGVENDEEEDDADVELIETESKEAESSEKGDDSVFAPPTKRLRLSEDSEISTKMEEQKEIESTDNSIITDNKSESLELLACDKQNDSSLSSTLKRAHDVIDLEPDEKSNDSKTSSIESTNKKPRTDEITPNEKIIEKEAVEAVKLDEQSVDLIVDTKADLKEDVKEDIKEVLKAIPSFKPIPLYPPPKFEVLKSEDTFSLSFLKKFRKSFDKMTKHDLEELVLQKVVEAIIHKSEFSEMRELIEKQEKLITAHRTKISELSKQFRDLEMVHNRVVKDIEQRNSQFIMPVKITRAVGLQVYIPNKKSAMESVSSGSSTPTVPSSPQRPPTSQATSSSSTSSLTSPQRQFINSQTESQNRSVNTPLPTVAATAANVRRGCVQKITPTRPVPGANASSSSAPSNSSSYRNNTNQSMTQPRILNKNASTTPSAAALQRARYTSPNQDAQRVPQQPLSRPTNMAASSQRVSINATQQKTTTNMGAATAAAQRRSDPMPQPAAPTSSTSSIVDNYMNTLTQLTGGNTAVSITPAKPKEKAVIDLTDEDEASTAPPPPSPSPIPSAQPVTQVPRRSLPAQNNTNSQIQYGRAAPPMARIPPVGLIANNKNRQMTTMQQAQKNNNSSFTSITTPPGTSITRINVAPNATAVQRVKYSHPAPLPATPPQAFNPSWKLPPPRPTIRISNLDNGIVISWTMEESMDRHAECVSYQIYAYQETSGPPMVDSWRHVGDVKAMLLPMAVTLTQFQEGQRYYFAVRAVDCHQRFGPFSLPKTWS